MEKKFWYRPLVVLGLLLAVLAFAGCDGDDGKDGKDGAPGAPGADGKSAYEIAVDNGYEGTEEEWLNSWQPASNESCQVCHGEDKLVSIEDEHPAVAAKLVVANIVVTSGAGATDKVAFTVFQGDGETAITNLTDSAFRFYIADIVPAMTETDNLPVGTWSTAYTERWLYERTPTSTTAYPFGTLTNNGNGNYTYTFAADLALGDTEAAPDFSLAHMQRLLMRVSATGWSTEAAIVEFMIPEDGANTGVLSQDESDFSRAIVVQEACTACHNDPLQRAAHGGGYQTPQGCIVCHTPLGETYGDDMQVSGFWLASLIHNIHSAGMNGPLPGWPEDGPVDFSEVTYPKDIKDCLVCHFDAGQEGADNWKTKTTVENCTTCHDVTFSGASPTHSGGAQPDNNGCIYCHPATGTGFGQSITEAHVTAYADENAKNYTASIALSPDANADGVYEPGEAILVTVTVSNYAAGDYNVAGATRTANLYVYGPRANALPVLTPGSTTDPAFDPATDVADQGRSMLIDGAANDPQILTDADGFKYQLFAIPEDLAPGTYMAMAYVTTAPDLSDCSATYRNSVCVDGWVLTNFQVGTATEEEKVAGECTSCHDQAVRWSTMFHRSYFGTDGCIACHDKSGNHADPISNRVHAVHSASPDGDLLGYDWSEITFPQNTETCVACHNSGNDTYITDPDTYSYACIGCHGAANGVKDHMIQMGAPFTEE